MEAGKPIRKWIINQVHTCRKSTKEIGLFIIVGKAESDKEYLKILYLCTPVKAVYCHPAYLTYMQSTSWETLGWKKRKLELRLSGEIAITSDMQMTPSLWQKMKKN